MFPTLFTDADVAEALDARRIDSIDDFMFVLTELAVVDLTYQAALATAAYGVFAPDRPSFL